MSTKYKMLNTKWLPDTVSDSECNTASGYSVRC